MYGYEDDGLYPPYVPVADGCKNIPDALLKQGSIWVDSQHRVHDITTLRDGHLDNIIHWLKENSGHVNDWKTPVIISPLMQALEAEQKRRIPKRNMTPRQALKDTMLNDFVLTTPKQTVDTMVSRIINGLVTRGFQIVKKP